jgi:hypothetical protein
MLIKHIGLVASLILTILPIPFKAPQITNHKQSDSSHKHFEMRYGEYSVKIIESTIQTPKPGTGSYWGGWGKTVQAVTNLRILRENEPVVIPRSSFADLSNVNQLKLATIKNGVTVRIEGGDASEGYYALITVINGAVVKRSVHWGEFPANSWEETRYHNSAPPDQ